MKLKKLLFVVPLLFSLVGCEGFKFSSSSSSSSTTVVPDKKKNAELFTKFRSNISIGSLPTSGDANILVIPVQFSDKLCSNTRIIPEGCATAKSNINNAFFGESTSTGWESVSTYYKKSSYGALNIVGEVTDWFTAPGSYASYETRMKASVDNATAITDEILAAAVNLYLSKNPNAMETLDRNKDGYIDGVWMVYDTPFLTTNTNMQSLMWAYTYTFYSETQLSQLHSYCWASYSFLSEVNYGVNKVDTHTMIHETGHLMGFDDYYNYDDSLAAPAGGIDMMDLNIGDHNAFSKYLAGWTLPTKITEEGTYTLKPFESSGESLVYGIEWNGTAYSDYLIFEYYTPTGLNQKDTVPYTQGIGTFEVPGIKIYHVDARVGKINLSTNKWDKGKTTTPSELDLDNVTDSNYYDFINSNTMSFSYNKTLLSYTPIIQLMEATGTNKCMTGSNGGSYAADATTLFKEGSDFGITKFTSFKFAAGSSKLNFKISSLTNLEATIIVTAK